MDIDHILRYFNAVCNVVEFLIIIWLVRDRRILIISLKNLATTVYQLSQPPPEHSTNQPQQTNAAHSPAQDVK